MTREELKRRAAAVHAWAERHQVAADAECPVCSGVRWMFRLDEPGLSPAQGVVQATSSAKLRTRRMRAAGMSRTPYQSPLRFFRGQARYRGRRKERAAAPGRPATQK